MVSIMEKGWCGIILLRGKEDKEKGKRHFVNPESVVWYTDGCQRQQLQGISTIKMLHVPGGLLREAKMLMRQNPWKTTPKF